LYKSTTLDEIDTCTARMSWKMVAGKTQSHNTSPTERIQRKRCSTPNPHPSTRNAPLIRPPANKATLPTDATARPQRPTLSRAVDHDHVVVLNKSTMGETTIPRGPARAYSHKKSNICGTMQPTQYGNDQHKNTRFACNCQPSPPLFIPQDRTYC